MRYGAWLCLQNNFEIRKFRTEIHTERRTAHMYIYTYIYTYREISIDITSVGLASARPNYNEKVYVSIGLDDVREEC